MIGRKKLSSIGEELQRALSETGEDPIRWLEERMAAPEHVAPAAFGKTEVLESLHRLLESGGDRTRRPRRGGAKKQQ